MQRRLVLPQIERRRKRRQRFLMGHGGFRQGASFAVEEKRGSQRDDPEACDLPDLIGLRHPVSSPVQQDMDHENGTDRARGQERPPETEPGRRHQDG